MLDVCPSHLVFSAENVPPVALLNDLLGAAAGVAAFVIAARVGTALDHLFSIPAPCPPISSVN
jgi:hypothetical protein